MPLGWVLFPAHIRMLGLKCGYVGGPFVCGKGMVAKASPRFFKLNLPLGKRKEFEKFIRGKLVI